MNVKLNDNVLVIAGKDKGKQGKVLATSPKANTVTVEGVRIQKKHEKARKANETSKIVEVPGPVDADGQLRLDTDGAILDPTQLTAAAESEAPKKRTRKRAAKAEETKTETPSANE